VTFKQFETLVDNPTPEKRVASVRVGVRLYNATGQLAVTDMVFQEGNKTTGYAPCLSEMLVATGRKRKVNAVIHGDTKLVLWFGGLWLYGDYPSDDKNQATVIVPRLRRANAGSRQRGN